MDSEGNAALVEALANELKEREFYLHHAGRTNSALGKAMFLRIADDELEHHTRLKRIHDKLSARGAWPGGEEAGLKVGEVGRMLNALIEKAGRPEAVAPDADDLGALQVACSFEAKGAEAYARLAERANDAREKAFFDLLSMMEREHLLALKDVQEYLEDPVSFFARKERHGLDGA
jgi:rubrerythrin